MKNYIVYNTTTGEIVNNVSTQSSDNFSPYPTDFSYLEVAETIDNSKYYINPKSQEFIAFSDKPDQYHTWNWTTKTWQDARTDEQKYTQAAKTVKTQRTNLLNASDWVVVKAMDQGTQVPEAWQTYRQQLRDITQQPGYPFTVIWPEPPQ
jgi:hypothetical protein